MTSTITITHHQTKPEYQWEIVVPEGPTIMLGKDHFSDALNLLGLPMDHDLRQQIESLPNGGSRSIEATVDNAEMSRLTAMSVKTV